MITNIVATLLAIYAIAMAFVVAPALAIYVIMTTIRGNGRHAR